MPIICDSREIEKFGFSDKNSKYKKVLFLGTHITEMSLDAGMYYMNGGHKRGGNPFYSILIGLYHSEDLKQKILAYKQCLRENKKRIEAGDDYRKQMHKATSEVRKNLIDSFQLHGIVINDLIGYCECDGAKDEQIIENSVIPNNRESGFHDLESLINEADVIVINGTGEKEKSAKYFIEKYGYNDLIRNSKVRFVLGSTSRGSNENKIEDWKKKIGVLLK